MTKSGAEIRESFISFFRDKHGHLHKPSSSLIPDNPTLLLTSAGMVQFVPIFLGNAPATDPPRAVTVQKCARAGGKDSDIENIGRTSRHHSFFEMLGNFSFGDYFKKEVIPWAWDFVTNDLGLEKEKLTATIFAGDEQVPEDTEAFEIWNKVVGLPPERILKMSRKDNFWGPPGPTGPCGPCSEIYYDRGPEYACSDDPAKCGIGICECDRYMEFWNLVFMELYKDEEGKFSPLTKKNVDTGSGLERVALILQKKNNTFETDLFFPLLEEVAKLAGKKYTGGITAGIKSGKPTSPEEKVDSYLKIIADHARCVTFLIADGVRTSNVGRGYVLRFIIRRAARFGRLLGINEPFLYKLVELICKIYGNAYPEVKESQALIEKALKQEEERFAKTIDRGMTFLEELLSKKDSTIDGKEAFNLYATYGFPIELTREIAEEAGKQIDMSGFEEARKKHEEVSSVSKFNVIITGEEALGELIRKAGETRFTGYDALDGEGEILAILKDGKVVEEAVEGDKIDLVLDNTPFYAESGGQLGDIGRLESDEALLKVEDTKKHEGLVLHRVTVQSGGLRVGDKVHSTVDPTNRQATVLHHSSAHIFHSAVRERLGKHVMQAGSQVGPATMRFDFNFERQLTKDEIADIEKMMNTWVQENAAVKTEVMSLDEAKKTGAIAMFGEKYGDKVRVVSMGDFSLEFCGGTHVANTAQIGLIKIVSEGSIASGVRRVEALSGQKAWNYISENMKYLEGATSRLKTKPADLASEIDRLQDKVKAQEKLNEQLQEKLALSKVSELIEKSEAIGDIMLVAERVDDISSDGLKALANSIKEKGDKFVVLLGAALGEDKVTIVCSVSQDLVKRGINAGKIVKEVAAVCGGGGGGRPDMAQAGGKLPEKLMDALALGKKKVQESGNGSN